MLLVVIGTVTYSLGAGWNVVDALYFAVATLTTTSVSDPDLVLQDGWLKLFTVFYLLVGIGILVEILRRLGIAFVEVRKQERREGDAPREGSAPTGTRERESALPGRRARLPAPPRAGREARS